jgi:hypothetical protein
LSDQCTSESSLVAAVSGEHNRLALRVFGLFGAVAEGPLAIGALVLIVLLVTACF